MKRALKKVMSLLVLIAVVFSFSGCSFNFFSIEALLSPPVLSGKNGEVQTAFNKLMSGKNIQLKTPTKGDYKSAFILKDIDGDGEDEAIVFYVDNSVDASVRLVVMECVNDTWVISTDVKGSGNGVYAVEFSDFNSDGRPEILVGWSLFDNKTARMITVYATKTGENGVIEASAILNEYYNNHKIVDFNRDGLDDLVLVYLDDSAEVQQSYLRVFSIDGNGSMVKYSETLLDSSVLSAVSIELDAVEVKGKTVGRLFIDCLKTDVTMFTEVVYWDSKKLVATRAEKDPINATLRSSKLASADIDGDGCLEVPCSVQFAGKKEAMTATVAKETYVFSLLKWCNFYGDKSEGSIFTVFDPIQLSLIKFTWGDEVTVRYDQYRGALAFCKWDSKTEEIKDELFSIVFVKNGDEIAVDGFLLLADANDGRFFYSITEEGKIFGITEEMIENAFIKL